MHSRAFLFLFFGAILFSQPLKAADLIAFWDTPAKGANVFNASPKDKLYYEALAKTGATWARLTFSKWEGRNRDFLLGDADKYEGLIQEDLALLRKELDAAHSAGIKVVIAPLTLPGARWSQLNDGKFDDRLWTDAEYQAQAARFWFDLASALKDHPAIAGYNILNEPAPEKMAGGKENGSRQELLNWQTTHTGSTRDLLTFYEAVIARLRKADALTPVMVDSGWYANPLSLSAWPHALTDERVLYAFHMYEPYKATSAPNMKRENPFRYPGVTTEYAGGIKSWKREDVSAHISAAFEWANMHQLPPTRIVAAEFGCMRRWPDCGNYLTDVIDAIEAQGGHWAFYSFREDQWEGMDYELPVSLAPGRFYWLVEEGKYETLPRNGSLMKLISAHLKNQKRQQ